MSFIYSKTVNPRDLYDLGLDELLAEYLSYPKKSFYQQSPRYKFWEYALAIRLCKENGVEEILDVNFKYDITYDIMGEMCNINIEQINYLNFIESLTKGNKKDFITCFGVLENIKNDYLLLENILRRSSANGIILITTDGESTKAQKIRHYTADDLFSISIYAEKYGYELYNSDKKPHLQVDYKNNDLVKSLVLRKTI